MHDADDNIKEQFCFNLEHILTNTCKKDKIILLSEFSTRVECDLELWNGIIGKKEVGKSSSNGREIQRQWHPSPEKMHGVGLVITNMIFRQCDKYKTMWRHPHSKHWHLLDYIIVTACD